MTVSKTVLLLAFYDVSSTDFMLYLSGQRFFFNDHYWVCCLAARSPQLEFSSLESKNLASVSFVSLCEYILLVCCCSVTSSYPTLCKKGMATHSSILAWRIPWTEEPGGLPSMGLQKRGMLRRLNLLEAKRFQSLETGC